MKLEASVVREERISWAPRLEEPAFHGWVDGEESAKKTEEDKADAGEKGSQGVNYRRKNQCLRVKAAQNIQPRVWVDSGVS